MKQIQNRRDRVLGMVGQKNNIPIRQRVLGSAEIRVEHEGREGTRRLAAFHFFVTLVSFVFTLQFR